MCKNKKHGSDFKLRLIKENQQGKSVSGLSNKWGISTSLLRKWIDHYNSSGVQGLLPRSHQHYTTEFKLQVIEAYNKKELSLRDCCLQYNIPTQSTMLSWLRKYEQKGSV